VKVSVRRSSLAGRGCFANQAIAPGETIFAFRGEALNLKEVLRRIDAGIIKSPDDPMEIRPGVFLQLDEPYFIINHSCNPNAVVANERDLVALKPIAPDEEITFDYSSSCPPGNSWVMASKCLCGAPNCRTVIRNIESVPAEQLRLYMQFGVQTYIREILTTPKILRVIRRVLGAK